MNRNAAKKMLKLLFVAIFKMAEFVGIMEFVS